MRLFLLISVIGYLNISNAQIISPCGQLQPQHIVVLGSSTAAGAGASSSDSAWVGRYRNYMQALNAGNQVTNLARGGYNTYRLMPTGHVPPGSRPDPDTMRNITAAIKLMPDAIIVNLPSNDVSAGFSVAEQLANFDTIVAHAIQAGIPIWVCTTQPRNFSSGSQVDMQEEVRDSIWAKYSPHVMDFWSDIADTNGWILPQYNSGDGVHLNDAGHRVLFDEVVSAALPDSLFTPTPYPNIGIASYQDLSFPCGGDPITIQAIVVNTGSDLTNSWIANLEVIPPIISPRLYMDTLSGLKTCEKDTAVFLVTGGGFGHHSFTYRHQITGDLEPSNDTISWTTNYLGTPSTTVERDTICTGQNATFQAQLTFGDTIAWYDDMSTGNPIQWGATLQTGPISNKDTFYAQAILGPLHYDGSIFTTDQSNVNWNGTMFDLVAQTDLSVDSFSLKVADVGTRAVSIYFKPGSHLGFETNAGAWTLLGHDTMDVTDPDAFVTAALASPLPIANGDTVGIYLEMQDPNVRLSYRNAGSTFQRSNSEIAILTGSGSSHNFGGLYFPRDWNGTVHYHHGFNPLGTCHSERIPAIVEVDVPKPVLGSDTTIKKNESLQLAIGSGFTNPQWSTGAQTNSITIDGTTLGLGIHMISVTATNQFGCTVSDTIDITVEPGVGINEYPSSAFIVYPNPSSGWLMIEADGLAETSIEVLDAEGRNLGFTTEQLEQNRWRISIPNAQTGVYLIRVTSPEVNGSQTVVISK